MKISMFTLMILFSAFSISAFASDDYLTDKDQEWVEDIAIFLYGPEENPNFPKDLYSYINERSITQAITDGYTNRNVTESIQRLEVLAEAVSNYCDNNREFCSDEKLAMATDRYDELSRFFVEELRDTVADNRRLKAGTFAVGAYVLAFGGTAWHASKQAGTGYLSGLGSALSMLFTSPIRIGAAIAAFVATGAAVDMLAKYEIADVEAKIADHLGDRLEEALEQKRNGDFSEY